MVGAPFRRGVELQAQVLPPVLRLKQNPHRGRSRFAFGSRDRSVGIVCFRPEFLILARFSPQDPIRKNTEFTVLRFTRTPHMFETVHRPGTSAIPFHDSLAEEVVGMHDRSLRQVQIQSRIRKEEFNGSLHENAKSRSTSQTTRRWEWSRQCRDPMPALS